MKRTLKVLLFAILPFVAASCRADDSVKDIRYDLVAYDSWPVFVFYRVTDPRNDLANPYIFSASNGGWDNNFGSSSIKHAGHNDDLSDSVEFDFIWREEDSHRTYQALVEISLRDLKPDPFSPEMGTLIFRFARGGDLQAVTYEPSIQPGAFPAIEVAHVCGSRTEISDPIKLREMERLSEHWKSDGMNYSIAPESVPSRCE